MRSSASMIAPRAVVRRVVAGLLLCATGVFAQQTADTGGAQDPPQQAQTDQSGTQTPRSDTSNQADRSAVAPPPGTVARKQPPGAFKTLVINTIHDQKVMWTSPFHMNSSNAPIWITGALVTGGLIASDRTLGRQLPNTNDQTRFSRMVSQPGALYTLYPIAGLFYFGGVLAGSSKSKEVGALSGEALTDALIISAVIKAATGRERPDLPGGNGNWGHWGGNTSFPSGHSIMGWALASVVAHEYHQTKIIPVAAYTLAAVVSASRFSARKHWASDIVAGGTMGWFIGRYVYRQHADEAIHHAPLAFMRPAQIVPYVNPNTASVGMGLAWNLGSR